MTCPLATPTDVIATQGSFADKIVVSWTSVSDAIWYRIYRSDTEAGAYTEIGTSTTETYENTGIATGTTYYYKVTATDAACESGQSASAMGKTCHTLTTPMDATATLGSFTNKIIVWWASVMDATGYKIFRSDSYTGTFSEIGTSATNTYEDTDLPAGTTFYYKVIATDAACESDPSAHCLVLPGKVPLGISTGIT